MTRKSKKERIRLSNRFLEGNRSWGVLWLGDGGQPLAETNAMFFCSVALRYIISPRREGATRKRRACSRWDLIRHVDEESVSLIHRGEGGEEEEVAAPPSWQTWRLLPLRLVLRVKACYHCYQWFDTWGAKKKNDFRGWLVGWLGIWIGGWLIGWLIG